MKLSKFETILKNNLPKWTVDINTTKAKFTLITTENKHLYFTDIDYIRNSFELKDLKIETKSLGENHCFIKIKLDHSLQFEKEEE